MTDPVESPLNARPPARRKTLIGPFTARQLATALGVVVFAAVILTLVTRPIAPGPGSGLPTALPAATPFLVGEPTEGLRPGNQAPDFTVTRPDGTTFQLTDLEGKPVRLEDLRGKLVWVNFWASWCPPCQGETPVLRDLDEAYADKGLEIVGVAVQETTVDNVRDYAERYELGYRIAFDTSADIFRLYRVFALPTQFFIAPDGRILEVVNGPLSRLDAEARIKAWLPED
ncbi:MAG TPA: TlpA disulfide reductase family protein [Candidatus Limnocylindrales bacterium]|nr:TlpA disulfide reductase family protein [Candidatus Limnocylindrales bacterium]